MTNRTINGVTVIMQMSLVCRVLIIFLVSRTLEMI